MQFYYILHLCLCHHEAFKWGRKRHEQDFHSCAGNKVQHHLTFVGSAFGCVFNNWAPQQLSTNEAKQLQTMRASLCPNTSENNNNNKTRNCKRRKILLLQVLSAILHNRDTQNMQLASSLCVCLSSVSPPFSSYLTMAFFLSSSADRKNKQQSSTRSYGKQRMDL